MELAALALYVAERVPGTESWQAVVLAFCWAFVANARRVANDFADAEEAFSRARQLWAAGTDADRERLAGWRLLDLEASLRREQQRFPEALDLLKQAREIAAPNASATGHILLNVEHVYERMGDFPAALATLDEAAPRIAASGDPRQAFLLRHKTVNNLCHLERYAEAETLLPEVQELAARQGNGLDSLRVLWLEARVDIGQGRRSDAEEKLEQVQREFTSRALSYDAALASLELAVLWLEVGRTAEVRGLAVGMAWIFEAQKIHREAMAALRLFTEAARQEAATVELARRAIAELKREGLA
jgi:tetratricopeptide (TPR) repeat protein